MSASSLLAQVLPGAPTTTKVPGFLASDLFLIILAAAAVFLGFMAWVLFIRGPKSDIPAPRSRRVIQESETEAADGLRHHHRRRKKKKDRRREHRVRNPTLSETGGLPPPRSPEASSSL